MRMLRLVAVTLLLCVVMYSCSANNLVDIEGIENFSTTEGELEINVHLLPDETFLEQFPYVSAQYNHRRIYESSLSIVATERSLIVLEYNDTYYAEAKQYCLQNVQLINTFEYNGYVFAENIMLAIGQDRLNVDGYVVPSEHFNMFAYNDEDCRLVFVGAYIIDGIDDGAKKEPAAWGSFWEQYFSEFYDLSA